MSLSDDHKKIAEFRPKWENRRKWIFHTLRNDFLLIWVCLIVASLMAVFNLLNATLGTVIISIALAAFGRSVLMLGSYIFGAVWDDKNFMGAIGGKSGSSSDYMDDVK